MKVLLFALLAACVVYVYSQREVSVSCPSLKEKDPVMLAHPCNCSSYYVCTPPQPIPMPCPPGLQFYEPKQRCEWPWIVKCVPQAGCRVVFNHDHLFEEQTHV